MSKTDVQKHSFVRRATTSLAFMLLVLCGLGLREKSSLLDRGQRAVKNPRAIQGQPIASKPLNTKPQKRELPKDADLEAMSKTAPAPVAKDGFVSLSFDLLSDYDFPLNSDGTIGQLADGSTPVIPANIKNLNQKKVALSGFMMPLEFEQAKASYFMLNKNQLLCCYGEEPQINEYCIVVMDKPTELYLDKPIVVNGTLEVGELIEDDTVLCVYQLSGQSVEILE